MTAAPTIKGWCPTLLSPMQSGDGWLARVKPSAATAERRSCAHHRRRRTPPRQRPYRPDLPRQFPDQGTQPPLGRAFRRDHHRRGARERAALIRGDPQRHGEPARSRRSIGCLRLPCCRARPRSHARRGAGALRRCPPNSASSSMAAGCCRSPTSPPTSWSRAEGGELAVQLDGGTLAARCAPSALAETVKALALAFLHVSCGTARAAAPHARAGDGRRRGGDLRRGRSDAVAMPPAPHARSAVADRLHIIGSSSAKRSFGVGLPFGRIEAEALSSLADLSERYGDGSLRTTPWRALLLPGIASAHAEQLARRRPRARPHCRSTPTRVSTSSPVSARRPARARASMRAAMRAASPRCTARQRATTPSMSRAASNLAPIAGPPRSLSSAATAATISSATVAPPTSRL